MRECLSALMFMHGEGVATEGTKVKARATVPPGAAVSAE